MKPINYFTVTSAACAALVLATATPVVAAQSVAEFYKGKTVTIAVGSRAGGSIDLNGRLVARHIGRHIPGNPSVIVQNVPGASSLKLANFLILKAKTDGTYIAALNRAALFNRLYYGKKSKAMFGPKDMVYLGAPNKIWSVAYAWHTSKIKTAKDLFTKQMVVGGNPGGTTQTIPELHNKFSGTKFKIVFGYAGGSEIDLAAEKGEVEGRISTAPASLIGRGWIKDKKVNVLFWNGLETDPSIAKAPLGLDFIKKKADRKLMELFFAVDEMGYPYTLSPKVPADRVAALEKALHATFKDPKYIAEAAKQRLEVNPVSAKRMATIIKDSYGAPKPMVTRLQDVLAAGRASKKKK